MRLHRTGPPGSLSVCEVGPLSKWQNTDLTAEQQEEYLRNHFAATCGVGKALSASSGRPAEIFEAEADLYHEVAESGRPADFLEAEVDLDHSIWWPTH